MSMTTFLGLIYVIGFVFWIGGGSAIATDWAHRRWPATHKWF